MGAKTARISRSRSRRLPARRPRWRRSLRATATAYRMNESSRTRASAARRWFAPAWSVCTMRSNLATDEICKAAGISRLTLCKSVAEVGGRLRPTAGKWCGKSRLRLDTATHRNGDRQDLQAIPVRARRLTCNEFAQITTCSLKFGPGIGARAGPDIAWARIEGDRRP